MTTAHMTRGRAVLDTPTPDVRIGDRLCCWLSDASAYPVITGWTDRTLNLSRYGLPDAVHRTFTVDGAPWWADAAMLTANLAGRVFVLADGGAL